MADAIEPIRANISVQSLPDLPFMQRATPPHDTISLSIPAQVLLLEQQGLHPVEIATQLGVTTDVVLTELGIAPVSPTSEITTK